MNYIFLCDIKIRNNSKQSFKSDICMHKTSVKCILSGIYHILR